MNVAEIKDAVGVLTVKVAHLNRVYEQAKQNCVAEAMVRQLVCGERMEEGTALWDFVGESEFAAKKALAEGTVSLAEEAQSILTEMNLIDLQDKYRDSVVHFINSVTIAENFLAELKEYQG